MRSIKSAALAGGVVLLVAVGALTGCGGSTEPEATATVGGLPELDSAYAAEMEELYQAAIEAGETELTMYSVGDPLPALYDAFMERYPEITVTATRLGTTELTSKLEQEVASGNIVADVVLATGATQYGRAQEGWYQQFEPVTVTADTLSPIGYREDGYYYGPFGTGYGLAYNSNEIDAEEVPQSWDDVVDPDSGVKLLVTSPTIPGGLTVAATLLESGGAIDESWLADLAALDPEQVASAAEAAPALISGPSTVAVGLGMKQTLDARDSGAPLGYVFPIEGGAILSPMFYSIMKGASNPTAAELFISWQFTPEAQEQYAAANYYGLMEGAPGPEGFPGISDLDELIEPPADGDYSKQLTATVARAKELFG